MYKVKQFAHKDDGQGSINIQVSKGSDVPYVAFSTDINVGGIGNTVAEAVQDLIGTARDLIKEYEEAGLANLHFSAIEHLVTLCRYFRKEEEER